MREYFMKRLSHIITTMVTQPSDHKRVYRGRFGFDLKCQMLCSQPELTATKF